MNAKYMPSKSVMTAARLVMNNGDMQGSIGSVATVCYSVLQCATVGFMKIRTITQRELRNQSAAVLREVEAGRTIIVSRNGTPVGELRPIKRRRFVPRAAIVDAAAKAARIDGAQFRADLDAVVDPRPYD
ncbi:MAG TPA: type II toxin-antitoxin system prevent-host-death family antitoxin [Steroidobacteraceae bacterium]|nr:type II toxin-antitoxin system prevent-host-death family antitoxin [Steroidobacteraceae bacterium]